MKDVDIIIKEHAEKMKTKATEWRTVCEVIRESYDIVEAMGEEDLRAELKNRLFIIYDMAKRMNKRLREYKHNWDKGFWEENKDYAADLERRGKR